MNYLLFVVYLFILCWLLLQLPIIKKLDLDKKTIIVLFLCKVVAGIAIGWVSIHIYGPGNDYWDLNHAALKEYQLLLTHPGTYFSNIFISDYPGGYGGIFSSHDSYWNDLKGNLLIKLVSIFNIFSRGDYYINSLFFNFIIFFGHVILYKLFTLIFKKQKWLVIIGCFLLPSTLYFSSGMHKDAIVLLMLSILIYCVYMILKEKYTTRRLLFICTSLFFLFLIRNYIFIALAPALVACFIATKVNWKPLLVFVVFYLFVGLLIFNIDTLFPFLKPLDIIINKQTEFLNLPNAHTSIQLTPLSPSFKSFAANAPQAFNHLLLRPYLWELPVNSLLPLNIELFIYQLILVLFIFYRKKIDDKTDKIMLCFFAFFICSIFLLQGYIVPNLGSIVRYRSIYLPFIITPLLCMIQWKNIPGLSKIINKNM